MFVKERSRVLTPRKHDLIIKSIKLHVLKPPSLVYAPGKVFLPPACEIRSMKHGDLDSVSMIDDQSCQEGSA